VPCVFLILGEVLHTLLRRHVERVDLGGGTLPWGTKHQTILWYVDDSLVMVRGDEQYVDELVRLLVVFSEASIMKFNWE